MINPAPEPRSARRPPLRRILVALDASAHSLAALAAAVDLAAGLGAEIEGLFVEDIALLRMADLPVTREVGGFTAVARAFDSRDLERQLRARAIVSRRALARLAAQTRVRWTFRVARGPVAAELLAAARHSDLIIVGRTGWSHGKAREIGSTAQALLAEAPRPLLVLRSGRRLDCPLCVLYDGSPASERALEAADLLLPWRDGDLRVFIPPAAPSRGDLAPEGEAPPGTLDSGTTDRLEAEVTRWLEARGHSANLRRLAGASPAVVASALHAAGGGTLVLPAGHPLASGEGLVAVMDAAGCGVLVVR